MKSKRRRDVLTLLGLGILTPQWSMASPLTFKDSSCNQEKKRKILVTYASEYGSTQGVANGIAKHLCQDGFAVDVIYVEHIKNIDNYEQVIIGSPIQYDKWMKEAEEFVEKYQEVLAQKSVAYFFTCLTLSKKSEKAQQQAQGYANELLALNSKVVPQNIGQFAGVLDYSKFSFTFRILARGMFAVLGVKEGDYRDWNAIKKWSNNIKLKDKK